MLSLNQKLKKIFFTEFSIFLGYFCVISVFHEKNIIPGIYFSRFMIFMHWTKVRCLKNSYSNDVNEWKMCFYQGMWYHLKILICIHLVNYAYFYGKYVHFLPITHAIIMSRSCPKGNSKIFVFICHRIWKKNYFPYFSVFLGNFSIFFKNF